MPESKEYDVIGIGAPVIDQILPISEEYLSQIPGNKGGMIAVDYESFLKIVAGSKAEALLIIGGSSSNTIKGLAQLGQKCAIIGKIGSDLAGKKFLESMLALGVTPLFLQSSSPTGQVACLVTPEGERTFRSFLGASSEMKADELIPEQFEKARLVHIEGYTLLAGTSLTQRAMELAKNANAKVSFDLASFEIVHDYKETIIDLISRHVDVLFANVEEIKALTGLPPEKGCSILKDICETVVVLAGKQGCWVGHRESIIYQPAFSVETIDTTGAGDLFASGFLHGYLTGQSLEECARFGAITGAAVVQVLGTDIPLKKWEEVKSKLAVPEENKNLK